MAVESSAHTSSEAFPSRDENPLSDSKRHASQAGPEPDPVIEKKLDDAFSRIVDEGEQRLERDWAALLSTGTVAGIEVGIGILALLTVEQRTGSRMLGGVAFSIGFLALLLGHSELFTEGFLIPVTTLVARRARARQVFRLWGATLAANLTGGWIITWLIVIGFPALGRPATQSASAFIDAGMGSRSVALGLMGGAVITLMTRMQHGTDSMPAKIAASVACAFVLAGLPLFHSILDSLIIFTALHHGHTRFGYLDWCGWLAWAVLWNFVGGVALVTLLRLVRSHDRVQHEREAHT
jgi:formate/nitrite transporter FocA (FNT family)